MSILKHNLSRKTKIEIICVLVIILALLALLFFDIANHGPVSSFLSNRDQIVSVVKQAGIFGPLLFIVLQFLQTVLAPIPGQVTGAVGGFLFGWWGILWSLIGGSLGYLAIFWLSKRYGRPLVEKIFKKEALEKFDFIAGEHAATVLFLIFLIPGLPDDMVCYVGGLTDISIKKLMVLITLGRIPSVVVVNYIGAGLGEENLLPVILVTLLVVIILGIVIYFREQILALLRDRR